MYCCYYLKIEGPANTPYEGGYYHGRVIYPPDYPLDTIQSPQLEWLTPNAIPVPAPETWKKLEHNIGTLLNSKCM